MASCLVKNKELMSFSVEIRQNMYSFLQIVAFTDQIHGIYNKITMVSMVLQGLLMYNQQTYIFLYHKYGYIYFCYLIYKVTTLARDILILPSR